TITNTVGGMISGANAVRNGATLVSNAGSIVGTAGYGMRLFGTSSTVINSNGAAIKGINNPNALGSALLIEGAGTVTNGDSSATSALIEGTEGVVIQGAGTVTNFGSIGGTAASGIFIGGGGVVANGNAGATRPLDQRHQQRRLYQEQPWHGD